MIGQLQRPRKLCVRAVGSARAEARKGFIKTQRKFKWFKEILRTMVDNSTPVIKPQSLQSSQNPLRYCSETQYHCGSYSLIEHPFHKYCNRVRSLITLPIGAKSNIYAFDNFVQ